MRHTPGPWKVEEGGDYKRILVNPPAGSDWDYEIAEVYSDDCDYDIAKANAQLIATAPELYEALNIMLEWGKAVESTMGFRFDGIKRIAESALAKARGEEVKP